MFYTIFYESPLGSIRLLADEQALLGAWFVGQKYANRGYETVECEETSNAVLKAAVGWLDAYFAGENPPAFRQLAPKGTAFQQRVWQVLQGIGFGQTTTYGQLAKEVDCASAQAVGGAVGKNPLSIFIPCHRVLGADGNLTGYTGGLERKIGLLQHEEQRRE